MHSLVDMKCTYEIETTYLNNIKNRKNIRTISSSEYEISSNIKTKFSYKNSKVISNGQLSNCTKTKIRINVPQYKTCLNFCSS